MTTETAAKKDTQKLQRTIVDGLEDVKAQDIIVFNTEHLSALFERVIIATGTSNRQTKALAASVRDAVREEGFPKPRTEGEENGEWIIVDCGAAVVHVMQPAIRQYYNLEEIWGDKPVRLKFGATKPVLAPPKEVAKPAAAKKTSLRRSSAAKTAIKERERAAKAEAAPKARPARAPARVGARPAVKSAVKPAVKAAVKAAPAGKVPAKKAVAKTAVKTAAPRKAAPRKSPSPNK
jgi:ribosome-associated protein